MENLNQEKSLNVFDFFKYIFKEHKFTIPVISFLFSVIVLIATLFMEDKFESSALVI